VWLFVGARRRELIPNVEAVGWFCRESGLCPGASPTPAIARMHVYGRCLWPIQQSLQDQGAVFIWLLSRLAEEIAGCIAVNPVFTGAGPAHEVLLGRGLQCPGLVSHRVAGEGTGVFNSAGTACLRYAAKYFCGGHCNACCISIRLREAHECHDGLRQTSGTPSPATELRSFESLRMQAAKGREIFAPLPSTFSPVPSHFPRDAFGGARLYGEMRRSHGEHVPEFTNNSQPTSADLGFYDLRLP